MLLVVSRGKLCGIALAAGGASLVGCIKCPGWLRLCIDRPRFIHGRIYSVFDKSQAAALLCRFRRANRSIAFWDNCCTRHLAVHDAGPFRRIIRRIQIACDRVHLL